MILKLSSYNLIAELSDGGCIVYNALTKNIVELNQVEAEVFFGGLSNITKSDLFNPLKEMNFIVDDDFDELEYFKLQWNRSLYASGILRHTILPNLACNLDCPYCFESKTGKFMSQETADAYISWLQPQLYDKKKECLLIGLAENPFFRRA